MRARGLKLKMFCDWFLKSESTQNMKSFYVLYSNTLIPSFFPSIEFSLSHSFSVNFFLIIEKRFVYSLSLSLPISFSDFKCTFEFNEFLKWIGFARLLSDVRSKKRVIFHREPKKQHMEFLNKDSILIDGVGKVFLHENV